LKIATPSFDDPPSRDETTAGLATLRPGLLSPFDEDVRLLLTSQVCSEGNSLDAGGGAYAPPAPRRKPLWRFRTIKRKASLVGNDLALFADAWETEDRAAELDQHDTPPWATEMIILEKFPMLKAGDRVVEPAAGKGSFLRAIPDYVEAIGIEIDPERARIARNATGRTVIVGDIRYVDLPDRIDYAVGNPPWDMDLLDAILGRLRPRMPTGNKAGFLLPAYSVQSEKRVMTYSQQWSMSVECVPRRLWPGLQHPVVYVEFIADSRRMLVNFFMYAEVQAIRQMQQRYQDDVNDATGGIWFAAICRALRELGGEGTLQAIYDVMKDKKKRPSENEWWKQSIRKNLYQKFPKSPESNRWRLPIAA
jgi:hypothetical protein